jgi:maleate cis-trans isomerase
MVPSNNTTMERELPAWLPDGSACRRIGIPRGKGMLTAATLPAYISQAMALARDFADGSLDLVAYGCTAAGFLAGPARDAEIASELAQVTGKPAVTTASAMTAVLQHIGARRIALVTPYQDFVNERLRAFLEQSGITVEVLESFGAQTVDELAAITPAQIAARAREAMRPVCDALFIACSQLPTRDILPALERDLGCPGLVLDQGDRLERATEDGRREDEAGAGSLNSRCALTGMAGLRARPARRSARPCSPRRRSAS